jgi:ankyrin repeat protein
LISAMTSNEEQLFNAVENDDVGEVKQLLAAGANPNIADQYGRTPLYYAAVSGNKEIVKILLDYHADPNRADNDGRTPLHDAAGRSGNKEIVQILLDYGADPNSADKYGTTPLLLAAEYGHKEIVQILLDYGADPNRADKCGVTPLHTAAEFGRKEIVQVLLGAKADPNRVINKYNTIPPIFAVNGTTPLYNAALGGYKEIIKILLAAGANPTIKDKEEDKTPADVAKPEIKKYIEGKIKITKLLLNGAKMGRIDVMRNALKKGALINMPDENGNTSLHLAIMGGNLDAVKYLLQFAKNINFSLKNNVRQTVIDLAKHKPDIFKIFVKAGYAEESKLKK